MPWIYNKTVNICGIYSSLEAFEFCWSSFADEHNTLPKLTKRNIKLNKFAFGTPWLLDLLCKHWFRSSIWNFCHWVADVPPCETSSATRSKEKQLFYYLSLSSLNLTPYFLDLARCISQFQGTHLTIWMVNIHITGTLTTISQNSQIPGICPGLKVGWRWWLLLEVTNAFYVMFEIAHFLYNDVRFFIFWWRCCFYPKVRSLKHLL